MLDYDLTSCLIRAFLFYLTLAKYGRCLHRETWDKGCTDIRYVTWVFQLLNYLPSYTTKGKLRECIATVKFELSYGDLNSNSHHCNSVLYTIEVYNLEICWQTHSGRGQVWTSRYSVSMPDGIRSVFTVFHLLSTEHLPPTHLFF